MSQMAMKFSL